MKPDEHALKKLLSETIEKHSLMEVWADGLWIETKEEGEALAAKRAAEAEAAFLRMMNSSRNEGGVDYQDWALHKALGISFTGAKTGFRMQGRRRRHQ
jgi:hypothetical protein